MQAASLRVESREKGKMPTKIRHRKRLKRKNYCYQELAKDKENHVEHAWIFVERVN